MSTTTLAPASGPGRSGQLSQAEQDVLNSGTDAARRLAAGLKIVERIEDALRANQLSAMTIEGADGVLVGGLIVVRGETAFAQVRNLLRAACGGPEQPKGGEM